MKLIIDCGSTKADWVIVKGDKTIKKFQTEGFNPNYTDKKNISSIITNEVGYKSYIQDITEIFFYGTGCGKTQNCNLIHELLKAVFDKADIFVTHDIMAACHALFGNNKGIACILGTGSNSCYYDGENIVEKAVSLGYIIGDDGSGSHIGKELLRAYFYKEMPDELSYIFEKEYDIEIMSIIDKIYHNSQPSKYLASFSKFAFDNINHEYIKNLCKNCFDEFIRHFVLIYNSREDKEVSFVGSIAYYFQDILKECLENKGLKLGKVIKNPIDGLIEYHSR